MLKRISKPHYAWVVCLLLMLAMFCNLGLCSNILAAYLPFIEETGITGRQGSSMVSIRCLATLAGTLMVSAFYRRFSLRTGLSIATLIGAAGAAVLSIGGPYSVYVLGTVILGLAFGLGTTVPVSMITERWFRTCRATAIAIGSAGSGLASIVFAPIVTANTLKNGLRSTFLIQAGFCAACALLIYLFVRSDPKELGLQPFGAENEPDDERENSPERAKLESFIIPGSIIALMYGMILLNGGAGAAASSHISVLTRTAGYTAKQAGLVATLFGAALFAGKLLYGRAADRMGTRRTTVLFVILFDAACLLTLLMDGTDTGILIAFAIVMGVGCAFFTPGMPLWAGELADEETHAKLLKGFQLMYAAGGILFTSVPGSIADKTGEYRTGYLIMFAMVTISLLLLLYFYKKRKTEYR